MKLDSIQKLFTIFIGLSSFTFSTIQAIEEKQKHDGSFQSYLILSICLGCALLFVILYEIFNKPVYRFFLRRKNIKSNFIYESLRSKLEYLNPQGVLINYSEEAKLINLKTKQKQSITRISAGASGFIDGNSIGAYNCSYVLSPSKSYIEVFTVIDDAKAREGEYYSAISLKMKDSFSKDIEWWDMEVQHFCKYYELTIVFTKDRIPKSYSCHKIENGKEVQTNITAILSYCYGNPVLSLRRGSFNQNEKYRLKWVF